MKPSHQLPRHVMPEVVLDRTRQQEPLFQFDPEKLSWNWRTLIASYGTFELKWKRVVET